MSITVADSQSIRDKVLKIVSGQLGVDKEMIGADARFIDDLGADSLDTVELVMAFEEAFNIEIPDSDAEKISTIQAAIDYIKARVED